MHFSIDFLISNRWIDDLSDVTAIKWRVGWNTMLEMIALSDPLRSSYSFSPPSALKILIIVPFCEADAIKVPSGFTLIAPSSVSCA